MSTELLEPETMVKPEASGSIDAPPEALPDPEPHEVEVAEHEGMTGIVLPIPGEHDVPLETPTPEGKPDEDEELATAMKIALGDLYAVQDRLDEAIEDHAEKKEVAANAKKRVETLTEDLSAAVRNLRDLKTKSQPDPKRYPLLDKPKDAEHQAARDAINASFPAPESIPPLPADTIEEHFRRRQHATPLVDAGLSLGITKILAEALMTTVAHVVIYQNSSHDLTAIKSATGSITKNRAEKIRDAFGELSVKWTEEWNALHPVEEEATS
jgi:hypothetical protein